MKDGLMLKERPPWPAVINRPNHFASEPSPITQAHPIELVYRSRPAMRFLRRTVDVAVGGAGIIATAPMLLLAGAAIWAEDRGPIFFTQRRVGRFGRPFTILKLRTMFVAACGDRLSPTSAYDARVTHVGRFLRRFSIDELPQLFNIVRGDMTLVGPRPEMPFVLGRYERWQHLRHLGKPGLTCTWQITHRSTIPLDRPEATRLDIAYLHDASPVVDAVLVVRTLFALFHQRGAY